MLVGATAPLATVAIPRLQAEDGAVIDVNTDLTLDNSDAVTDFTKAVLGTEKFELNIYGRPDLKEGPLPTSTVTFNKTVAMNGTPFSPSLLFVRQDDANFFFCGGKGMNGLKGFELQDIMISLIPGKDGTNMNGSVSIPNPSVITVSMVPPLPLFRPLTIYTY